MAKISGNLPTPAAVRTEAPGAPAKSAPVAPVAKLQNTASSSFQAGVAQPSAPIAVNGGTSVPAASSVKFDTNNPELEAFAASKGWNNANTQVGITSADLVYTTDDWKTTRSVPLQYLFNNDRGFLLRDVPPGTNVEYAIHAQVYSSHDHFRSADERADVWLNNGGQNYHAVSGDPSGF